MRMAIFFFSEISQFLHFYVHEFLAKKGPFLMFADIRVPGNVHISGGFFYGTLYIKVY